MLIGFSLFDWAADGIANLITGFLLFIDSVVYSLISWVYQIIMVLCNGNILNNNTEVMALMNRLYVVLGVIMMFVLAYSLLKSLINPDDLAKDKKSPVKVITNVLISIAAIAFVPTIFGFAMDFQSAILNQGTIGKIILGSTVNTGNGSTAANSKEVVDQGGNMMAATVLNGFLHPNISNGTCKLVDSQYNCDGVEFSVGDIGAYWSSLETNGDFLKIPELNKDIVDGKITYYYIISTIAGAFVLLVLLSYCFDIALRMVKLAVFEIMAPLPILCRIVPNEQASKVFSNWLKATISTYIEVFIRMAILFFGVWIIKIVINNITSLFVGFSSASPEIVLIAQVLVIVGIIMFIKQAPEIIKEITGLDGGKYNPLKTAKQGLSFIAGGIAGGSPLAAYRAWEQAGQAKDLLDFSAIGNQYKRREAKKEAKAQGASTKDRAYDALRKRFGFETKLEEANRRIDRGLDMSGQVQEFKNETDGAIEIINADGSTTKFDKGDMVQMDDKTINALQHKKDVNAQTLSEKDEAIRHIKEGKDLDQKYIDWRGKIKKKALEKINEGHNNIKKDLVVGSARVAMKDANGNAILDANGNQKYEDMNYYKLEDYISKMSGVLSQSELNSLTQERDRIFQSGNKGTMNYAAMLAYKQSRINAGADASEISMLEDTIKTAEDKMWVEYSDWALKNDKGGEISSWFEQAVQMHDEIGLYDSTTGRIIQFDKSSFNADSMEFFEGKNIRFIDKKTGQVVGSGMGFDKTAKKFANDADTKIQHIEIEKTAAGDETKRIDRMLKQVEEAKTDFKSSAQYQAYKASDNANKINDSGKK